MNTEASNIVDGVEEGLDSKGSILERKIVELITQPEFGDLTAREVVGTLELVKLHFYSLL